MVERASATYVKNLARVGARYSTARDERQQDHLKAFQFYSQAAQYGHAGANYELGVMYDQGVPGRVEQDPLRAAAHYIVAAEQDMAAAKFNLGLMYEEGRGVAQNAGKALALWSEAAALNHVKSMVRRPGPGFQHDAIPQA